MNLYKILEKVSKGEMSPEEAYPLVQVMIAVGGPVLSPEVDVVVPDMMTEKNRVLSRAMTYITEDAQEFPLAKEIFDELAGLMDRPGRVPTPTEVEVLPHDSWIPVREGGHARRRFVIPVGESRTYDDVRRSMEDLRRMFTPRADDPAA